MIAGPKNLITDVPGLRVGNAQDDTLKSGTTVVLADKPFTASVHVMGGAPGARETDLLAPDKSVAAVDALVLSGGSAYGLDACSGVVDGLRAAGRGFQVGGATIPLVPGAILFDLLNGGDKDWTDNPYRALGRQAFNTATETFSLGTAGAGTGAMSSMLKGGLGSASLVLPDGSTVGALVAANPVGAVTTPGDKYFYAAPFELNAEFGGFGPDPASGLGLSLESRKVVAMSQRANTTIAIIATDANLTKAECQRVAVAAHDGIGRATVPAHTPMDGDLVFALTTGDKPAGDLSLIGHAASLCLARAIARAIYEATPHPDDLLPCWRTLNA
ncbi:P1 family peptidase [Sulfitobacter sp. M57]|uniref:P1 family peptidase n=1 Tax=unclassified Sulfitobacter TaxID=196795 RepID=UPI0023E28567|nr:MULTISPECIES: P1 family peptidase [unclassified Sulfitobacter]MDF3415064.1 P1 family peptidase [Sulfitobacter sp. KE5]MDF3422545.1 P1 family peptidase [Sulfitobacter sp. KE43]MDF3433610.1 P1 family peptidase [Sulfitobacter sp. KE42]MDF3459250.1 P1 family peptidase [Sulfitobacter sp. S74]MDF3463149.1 P1 family peptidase [Sulfitobacter sp. Ks18]